jgi:hypothetical protein
MKQCDVVLRLPGESEGSDFEIEVAKHRDMPVFDWVADVVQFANGRKPWEFVESNNCNEYFIQMFGSPKTKEQMEEDAKYGPAETHSKNVTDLQTLHIKYLQDHQDELWQILNSRG